MASSAGLAGIGKAVLEVETALVLLIARPRQSFVSLARSLRPEIAGGGGGLAPTAGAGRLSTGRPATDLAEPVSQRGGPVGFRASGTGNGSPE
ncbi:hypothetical protein ACQKLZ_14050, partial [Methylobacterium tarhaniae]